MTWVSCFMITVDVIQMLFFHYRIRDYFAIVREF